MHVFHRLKVTHIVMLPLFFLTTILRPLQEEILGWIDGLIVEIAIVICWCVFKL